MNPRDRALSLTLAATLALDLASKALVASMLAVNTDRVAILGPWLGLVHVRNPGAAFGMFQQGEHARTFLLVLAAIMTLAVLGVSKLFPARGVSAGVAVGLAAAGILGNGLDRLFRGEVVDFIAFTAVSGPLRDALIAALGTTHWPAFNVADAALALCLPVFGAALLDLDDDPATPTDDRPR